MARQTDIEIFNEMISFCLQGNCADGLLLAKRINTSKLPVRKQKVVTQFLERFSSPSASHVNSHDAIKRIIAIYERYWHQVLLDSTSRKKAENLLIQEIVQWLESECKVKVKKKSSKKIVTRLKNEIEKMGFFCITGTIAPFQELEIWQEQKSVTYKVKLPETTEKVKTVLMSKFLTKGWIAYATMGLNYPGGWAKKEGLYCNTSAYDLQSEKFKVSYLAHEAQHFADYKRFPKLEQIDLEYRAKLAEFALSIRTTKKMYQIYASRAADNKNSPHAFSYYCVVRDLSRAIVGDDSLKLLLGNRFLLDSKKVNLAATKLLKGHTTALKKKGAKKVRAFVS